MESENVLNNNTIKRNSSFELLRIIAMLMIVFCHFATHGGFVFNTDKIELPHLWYNLLRAGGSVGVDVFVLISGYFLIDGKTSFLDKKYVFKTLKLWGRLALYSLPVFLIFVLFGINAFDLKTLIRAALPVTFERWWFASTYFVMYLFHPFLNRFLCSLDKRTYQKLLVLLLVCWCIIPTFTTKTLQLNNLLTFFSLYTLAGYYMLFGLSKTLKAKTYALMSVISYFVLFLSSAALDVLGTKWRVFATHDLMFFEKNSLFTLACAILLFLTFATLKMPYNKLLNTVSSATFGVYLLHDSDEISPWLWKTVFKNAEFQHSALLVPYTVGVCLLVFAACTVIDLIRQKTVEKLYLKYVNKAVERFIKQ